MDIFRILEMDGISLTRITGTNGRGLAPFAVRAGIVLEYGRNMRRGGKDPGGGGGAVSAGRTATPFNTFESGAG